MDNFLANIRQQVSPESLQTCPAYRFAQGKWLGCRQRAHGFTGRLLPMGEAQCANPSMIISYTIVRYYRQQCVLRYMLLYSLEKFIGHSNGGTVRRWLHRSGQPRKAGLEYLEDQPRKGACAGVGKSTLVNHWLGQMA
jgi:hypothetical protein